MSYWEAVLDWCSDPVRKYWMRLFFSFPVFLCFFFSTPLGYFWRRSSTSSATCRCIASTAASNPGVITTTTDLFSPLFLEQNHPAVITVLVVPPTRNLLLAWRDIKMTMMMMMSKWERLYFLLVCLSRQGVGYLSRLQVGVSIWVSVCLE